jgi:hypothetical protein
MQTKIERARDAVIALLEASNPQDEFFLTTFADQPAIIQDFSSNTDDIRAHLAFTVPKGRTSLLDAIVRHQQHEEGTISEKGTGHHF